MNPCLGLSGSCAASSYKIHRAPPAVAPSPLSPSLDSFYYFTSRLSTTCVAKNDLQSPCVARKLRDLMRKGTRNTHRHHSAFSARAQRSPSLLHHGEHTTPIKQKSERGCQKKASRGRPTAVIPSRRFAAAFAKLTSSREPIYHGLRVTLTALQTPTLIALQTTHPSTSGCHDLYPRQHHATKHVPED